MTQMCTDVTVVAVVKLTKQVKKLIKNNAFGYGRAVKSSDKTRAIITLTRADNGLYEVPLELINKKSLEVMLVALERDVKGVAPHVSLVTGDNGEELTLVDVYPGPGTELHSRPVFMGKSICRLEWSRVPRSKNDRYDRFMIERDQAVLTNGFVEVTREVLFEETVKVSQLRTKPAIPVFSGEDTKWKKPAAALLARWACTKPGCSSHYAADPEAASA